MSTKPAATSVVPEEYAAFVDDAAMFPPGNAALADAVSAYRRHAAAPYAGLLGPFVVSDVVLPDLASLLAEEEPAPPLPVTVVVSGGAGSLEPAARWATGSSALELRSLEAALRDLDDLPGAARRTTAAADATIAGLDTEVPVFVELPLAQVGDPGWLAAADEVAMAGLHLKLRTGGVEAYLFPPAPAVAAALDAALDRELPFKCTAGLHHAVRHRAPETGFEHHGFLNVLLATRAAWDGADQQEVVRVLEEQDPEVVATEVRAHGPEALQRTRRWFTSFGCCGVEDPLEDLVALGLVARG